MNRTFMGICVVSLAVVAAHAQEQKPTAPPQFLTRPILLHVGEPGLDHGHFLFTEGAAIPSPLAPRLGTAALAPATFTGTTATAGREADASAKPDSYEGETGATSAVGLLVGASNRVYPGNCGAAGANQGAGVFGDCSPLSYASTDGVTWTAGSVPRILEGTNFGICFDPSIDYDKNGTFYYAYGCAPLSGSYPNGVFVASSADGVNWTAKPHVTFNRKRFFDDKYYMAIDRSNSAFANRIYVSWDRNVSNNQILYIAHSSDGGATWSAPVKVNDGTSSFERVIGAYPAVDQNSGVVYDSWHDYARNIIFVDKSTDGGATWGADHAAAATHAGFGTNIGCVGGRSQGPAHALKVGPSGTLYLVYADPSSGANGSTGFDILLTMSTNGGATWSAPITLNDDGTAADQFHPTLSVESNGIGGDKITVSFFDRRNDPANCQAYVYATTSIDNGATWSANLRVTSAPSNFDGNANGPGDYSSSTPAFGGVWPFQADHRATNAQTASGGAFDVYSAEVQ